MKSKVIPTDFYEARFKRLKKKFRSLDEEMRQLVEVLEKEPYTGDSLGSGLYKIRLANKSKGKGKSGGFRIITYLLDETEERIEIYLVIIYDKSEESSAKKDVLLRLVHDFLGE